jgi:hypothetical protein
LTDEGEGAQNIMWWQRWNVMKVRKIWPNLATTSVHLSCHSSREKERAAMMYVSSVHSHPLWLLLENI